MRWMLLLPLVLLISCASETIVPHGTIPAQETNIPGEDGELAIQTNQVRYFGNISGFEARPQSPGIYPGIVMIHEWWGLNENIRTMAENLASHGYHVLAVDLYEGKVAATPEEARSLVQEFNETRGLDNLQAAASYLRTVSNGRVASLGWCFGGGQSFSLAQAERLDAAIIYYGQVETDPSGLAGIDEPVLGIFAGEDESIPVEQAEEFDMRLNDVGVEHEIIIYQGVRHAFANPSGDRYAPEEAEDAWQRTLAFLDEELKEDFPDNATSR